MHCELIFLLLKFAATLEQRSTYQGVSLASAKKKGISPKQQYSVSD